MKFDPFKDGISSVELIDHMGSDLTVVNAARVSMAKESEWGEALYSPCSCAAHGASECVCGAWDEPPIRRLSKKDCGLISYLAKHNHWTPFSHPQVQLRIKMPIFVARQWFKHMIGFTRNEVSRRYVDDTPELYIPGEWRRRAESVKQGSSNETVDPDMIGTMVGPVVRECVALYEDMLDCGVCPEQARMVLPQSMYTEFYETGSLAAYARLAQLRLDPHAQKEVRLYAECIDSILSALYPVSWAALQGARK